mgnify:CR=1 FL=1
MSLFDEYHMIARDIDRGLLTFLQAVRKLRMALEAVREARIKAERESSMRVCGRCEFRVKKTSRCKKPDSEFFSTLVHHFQRCAKWAAAKSSN